MSQDIKFCEIDESSKKIIKKVAWIKTFTLILLVIRLHFKSLEGSTKNMDTKNYVFQKF